MPRIQVKEIWKVDLPDTQAHDKLGIVLQLSYLFIKQA